MAIKKVFVIGAGTMGNGIAQVSAQAGYDVVMSDIKDEFIKKGLAAIEKSLDRLVKKGTMPEGEKTTIMSRIKTTVDNKDAKDADMVIEAAPEILDLKKSIFKQLDEICKPDAILATNTSSLPIGEIAAATKRPAKVIGIHFMNPVPVMKGVEVIPGRHTAADVLEASKEYVKKIGKEPCEARDYAGFIVSRLVDALMNEAFLLRHGRQQAGRGGQGHQALPEPPHGPAGALRPGRRRYRPARPGNDVRRVRRETDAGAAF